MFLEIESGLPNMLLPERLYDFESLEMDCHQLPYVCNDLDDVHCLWAYDCRISFINVWSLTFSQVFKQCLYFHHHITKVVPPGGCDHIYIYVYTYNIYYISSSSSSSSSSR